MMGAAGQAYQLPPLKSISLDKQLKARDCSGSALVVLCAQR